LSLRRLDRGTRDEDVGALSYCVVYQIFDHEIAARLVEIA
jgi:hypothetical protein